MDSRAVRFIISSVCALAMLWIGSAGQNFGTAGAASRGKSASANLARHVYAPPKLSQAEPLHPNHQAIRKVQPRAGRHHFARRLYGPPGALTTIRPRAWVSGHRISSVRARIRSSSIPTNDRRVPQKNGRARHYTAGCPWTCVDIGSDSPAGSAAYTGSGNQLSTLTLTGGGNGVNTTVTSNSTEGFYYTYQAESSDFALTGKITGQTQNGSHYDNTGMMLRAGTGSNKAYYYAYTIPTTGSTTQGGIYVDYLAANGGTPTNLAIVPESGSTNPGNSGLAASCETPGSASGGTCYLGIERRTGPDGTEQLEAYWSQDGTHWQAIWGSNISLASNSPLYATGDAGVASTSSYSGNSSTAYLSSVVLSSSPIYDEYPAECPPTFQCNPISVSKREQWAIPANSWSSSAWTMSGAGTYGLSSGGTSDTVHWNYQPMNGDGTVSAQVGPGYEFPQAGSTQYGIAQYGVMVRASDAGPAPFFAAFIDPCQGLAIAYRTTSGAGATVAYKSTPPTCDSTHGESGFGPTASESVMVKRTGTSYQAYYNTGSGWTSYLSSQTISTIPTSHRPARLCPPSSTASRPGRTCLRFWCPATPRPPRSRSAATEATAPSPPTRATPATLPKGPPISPSPVVAACPWASLAPIAR